MPVSFKIKVTGIPGLKKALEKKIQNVKAGVDEATLILYQEAKILCPRFEGFLAASLTRRTYVGKKRVTGTVRARTRYAIINEKGRGPVRPTRRKALKLNLGGGRFIFRNSVGPAKGSHFMEQAKKNKQTAALKAIERNL